MRVDGLWDHAAEGCSLRNPPISGSFQDLGQIVALTVVPDSLEFETGAAWGMHRAFSFPVTVERSRTKQRLEASLVGLCELELRKQRQECLVLGALALGDPPARANPGAEAACLSSWGQENLTLRRQLVRSWRVSVRPRSSMSEYSNPVQLLITPHFGGQTSVRPVFPQRLLRPRELPNLIESLCWTRRAALVCGLRFKPAGIQSRGWSRRRQGHRPTI